MKKNIIILGAGFGGLRCALDLEKKIRLLKNYRLILIDKQKDHLFTPLLYEMVCGQNIDLAQTPLVELVHNKKIQFLPDEVKKIDIAQRKVFTQTTTVDFEYLVIALGSETDFYHIPGLSKHAFSLKTYNDANRVCQALEGTLQRVAGVSPAQKALWRLRIVVVGGGPTGVELAAILPHYLKTLAWKYDLPLAKMTISLVEAGLGLLPSLHPKASALALSFLRKQGVEVFLKSPIKESHLKEVVTAHRKIKEDILIWTAGVKAHHLVANTDGLAKNKKGQILVDETLEAQKTPRVFVVGDNAFLLNPKNSQPYPGLAAVALSQGKLAAENILRLIKQKPLKKFRHFEPTVVLPLGKKLALLVRGNFIWFGRFAHLVRFFLDRRYLRGIRT
ncbi:FAD-dependent oxidoreductase [Candidatus Berkelbacteria bacterium]|nr:FAD-dependent oxidoreductase [Candidatus Berkelbacteria bacterium]